MPSFEQLVPWRNWRWHSAMSLTRPTARSYTLRELSESLDRSCNDAVIRLPDLERLAALVKEDLAAAEYLPEHRGGPDARRPWAAWRARYNRLDRYLRPDARAADETTPGSQEADASALSDAENEGWPVHTRSIPDNRPIFRTVHPAIRAATGDDAHGNRMVQRH